MRTSWFTRLASCDEFVNGIACDIVFVAQRVWRRAACPTPTWPHVVLPQRTVNEHEPGARCACAVGVC